MKKCYYTLILGLIIFISCDKNTDYVYIDENGNICDVDNNKNQNSELNITAGILQQSELSTGITPMQVNRYAHIYVYKNNQSPLNSQYLSMGVFKCETIGTLTSVSWPITLKNGTYNLYSAGSNYIGVDQGPNFYNGIASNLSQGVDYLWWKQSNVTINNGSNIVPITYSHSCAEIVIKFSASKNNVLNKLSHVDITLGNTVHCKMALASGYITPSKSISNNPTMMIIDEFETSVITLPIAPASSTKYLTSTILATVNNQQYWYTLRIPLPSDNNSFLGGNSYVYSAVFEKVTGYAEDSFIDAKLESVVKR